MVLAHLLTFFSSFAALLPQMQPETLARPVP
jgi:hypothetical protein